VNIKHPLQNTKSLYDIKVVLKDLASQENCDGEPYDQILQAVEYIASLEKSRFVWLDANRDLPCTYTTYDYTGTVSQESAPVITNIGVAFLRDGEWRVLDSDAKYSARFLEGVTQWTTLPEFKEEK
jgi:hypothetical protein